MFIGSGCINFGNLFAFLTGVHWAAKPKLQSSDFILKSDTSLPSAGMHDFFISHQVVKGRTLKMV